MQIPKEIAARLTWSKYNAKMPLEPRQIVAIEHAPDQCEDCGKLVTNRRTRHQLKQDPVPHWQHYCVNCRKCKDPDTGEYTCNQVNVARKYLDKFKGDK